VGRCFFLIGRTVVLRHFEFALYEWHCRAEKKITLSGNGLIERAKKFWIALAQFITPTLKNRNGALDG
jgi:hypothetical protein